MNPQPTKPEWEIHTIVWQLAAQIWDCSKEKDTDSSIDYQKRVEKRIQNLLSKEREEEAKKWIDELKRQVESDRILLEKLLESKNREIKEIRKRIVGEIEVESYNWKVKKTDEPTCPEKEIIQKLQALKK